MSKKGPQKTPKPAGTATSTVATRMPDTTMTSPKVPKEGSLIKKLCIALTVITFLLYVNTLQNGYVLDDVIMVKDNTIVAKGLKGIGELLTTPHMRGYLKVPNDDYRPLSLVTFAIERQFFGEGPAAHHFFNIAFFAGCVLLFFLFLHRFFDEKKPIIAFIGALLFALHPVHTEVVANIKSRDELLCFLFGFLSLNLMMRYMKEGKAMQLVVGLWSLFLAFMAKENVITFIGVVPLLFFFFKNEDKKRAAFATVGTIGTSIMFIVVAQIVLRSYHANESSSIEFIDNALVNAPNIGSRIATAVYICGKYLYLLFIPYPLVCNYSFNSIPFVTAGHPETMVKAAVAFVLYGAMLIYAVMRIIKNKKDPFAFAIMFYLMTISLFTNLFMLIGAEMAERFLFMASAGLCMAVAFAVDKWIIPSSSTDLSVLKSRKLLAILVPVTLIFGGMAIARNTDWKDNVAIYKADYTKSPNDCRLAYYVGTALAENEYTEETDSLKRVAIDKEAVVHLRQSIAMYNGFAEANAELGRVYGRLMINDSAEHYDLQALKINPMHVLATNNLGNVYLATKRYKEAMSAFSRAIQFDPGFKLAYANLALTYQQIGLGFFGQQNYDSAAKYFASELTLTPNDANVLNNLGATYLNQKNYPAAIEQFKKCIAADPKYVNAYSNLGRSYYFMKQWAEAVTAFNGELALDPKSGKDMPYLSISYKGIGNMEMANKYGAIAKQIYPDFKL